MGRVTQQDKITGIASLVLLISLFLPWFTVSANEKFAGVAGVSYSVSGNGVTAHGYLWVVFLLCLGIIGLLVVSGGMQLQLPLGREMLLLGATGLNLLLVLLAFFLMPGAGAAAALGVSVGWSFGAFISLIAAIAACAPLALPLIKRRAATAS